MQIRDKSLVSRAKKNKITPSKKFTKRTICYLNYKYLHRYMKYVLKFARKKLFILI